MPTRARFGVIARLYTAKLGPNVTDVVELGSTSLHVQMRGPLHASCVRSLGAPRLKNPQITVDEATDTWTYLGEVRVQRWSESAHTHSTCPAARSTHPTATGFLNRPPTDCPFPCGFWRAPPQGFVPLLLLWRPSGAQCGVVTVVVRALGVSRAMTG